MRERSLRMERLEDRRLLSVNFTGTYSQNFDSLPTSGIALPWTNDVTLEGWHLFRQPAPGTANFSFNAGDGSSGTGAFYSFGTNGSEDRALGSVGSGSGYFGSPGNGSIAGWIAVSLTNATDATINVLDLSFDGEQWRNGGNASSHRMELQYGFGDSFSDVTEWHFPENDFLFVSPKHTESAAALNGNTAANRQNLGGTITTYGWTPASTLWIRWIELNDFGADHGMAIDNFSATSGDVNNFYFVADLLPENGGNGSQGVVFYGIDEHDASGQSVTSAGDINGDGINDLVISARGGDGEGNASESSGEIYVVFGKSDWSATPAFNLSTIDGSNGFRLFGVDEFDAEWNPTSLASGGDLNGDGFDDLVIGLSGGDGSNNEGTDRGEICVVFGKADWSTSPSVNLSTLDGTNGFIVYGVADQDYSGTSTSVAGDFNGDGCDDLVIGAHHALNSGETYVIFGRKNWLQTPRIELASLSMSNGFVIYGIDLFDGSGISLFHEGDINGDGFDDLIIGALSGDGAGNAQSSSGESYVVFGRADWSATQSIDLDALDGSNGFTLYGAQMGDMSGISVSAGDVNGDGYDDVIVGAYTAENGANGALSAGETLVVFGKANWSSTSSLDLGALNGANGFAVRGTKEFYNSGYLVSASGDVNGDGFQDLLIGGFRGEAHVLYGRAIWTASPVLYLNNLEQSDGFTILEAEPNDFSTAALSFAGDLNGDGFDDVVVGAHGGDGPNNLVVGAGESYVIFGRDFTHLGSVPKGLSGTGGANVLIGGLGDDTLVGGGGADVLRGGAGDDFLVIDDLSFRRIVGGTGNDWLFISGAGLTVDLTTIADNRLVDVEEIVIATSGATTLVLNQLEVLNLSGSTNTLLVNGILDHRVFLMDIWNVAADEVIDGETYQVYVNGQAKAKVHSNLTVVTSAALLVDSLSDVVDGNYGLGNLSLREAIGLANNSVGASTITFAPSLNGGTITLNETLFDELVIDSPVTIDGGGQITISGGDNTGIFRIDDDSAEAVAVELRGLTLRDGTGIGDSGGAILSRENLTLRSMKILDNATTGFGGGGVAAMSGSLTVIDSTVAGNSSGFFGGGLYAAFGVPLVVESSTLSGNFAGQNGGAINANGALTMVGVTVSGNLAEESGGGVFVASADPRVIRHSTITNNTADADDTGPGAGGGIFVASGGLDLDHTIVAGNFDLSGAAPDLHVPAGGIEASYSFIGNRRGSALVATGLGSDTNGNRIGPDYTNTPLLVFVEMAAMGDFEAADDSFSFEYSMDGGPFLPLFTISVDEEATQTYTLSDGDTFTIPDPLSVDGTVLHNGFQTIAAPIPMSGGSVRVRFTASTDGANEAFAWRNLRFFVASGPPIGVAAMSNPANDVYVDFVQQFPDPTSISASMFGIRRRLTTNPHGLPFAIADDSASIFPGDTWGIITETDLGYFFGVSDTVNSSGNDVNSATWTFENVGVPLDPMLGPLADNGGPTLTHAPLTGSPVVNAGRSGVVAGSEGIPQYDQRGNGNNRVSSGRIDIGAFEVQSASPASGDFDGDGDVDGRDFLLWQRGGSPNPLSSGDLGLWQEEYGGGGLSAVGSQLSAEEDWVPAGTDAQRWSAGMTGGAGAGISDFGFMISDWRAVNVSDRSRDGETVFEDSYTEQVDRALEELATVPIPTRSFGEMATRRGVARRLMELSLDGCTAGASIDKRQASKAMSF